MRAVAAIVIFCALATVARADQSAPSQRTLAEMGLAGLQTMSDEQAVTIRGEGFDAHSILANTIQVLQNTKAVLRNTERKYRQSVAKFKQATRSQRGSGHKSGGGKRW